MIDHVCMRTAAKAEWLERTAANFENKTKPTPPVVFPWGHVDSRSE